MADTCVARVPVFSHLTGDDQRRVAGVARPTRLAAGEVAWSPISGTADLLVVHTGRLTITRTAADGAEQLVRVLGPGEFTGETAVFTRRLPDHLVAALDESRLCVFRHDDLEALIREHPEIGLRMLAVVGERLLDTEDRLRSLLSQDVESRVAGYLLTLPTTWVDGVATVRLPLAKKDVASLLDTSPESLSRTLTRLAGRGLITTGRGRAVTITQPTDLHRLADQG
ncbi:Crp/Fnr family transcriptional regulator [Cellulomonas soli]